MPMKYIVPSLHIAAATKKDAEGALEEFLAQLMQLEEDHFIVGFDQRFEKDLHKS